MDNNINTISLVIIGFNTQRTLFKLLESINNISCEKKLIEVVYVDDGSTDSSLSTFTNYILKFKKSFFGFKNNMGRVHATSKGLDLATGDWVLFLQSNVIVRPNIIEEYYNAIDKNDVIAIMGAIEYESDDLNFQTYLNHKRRGINQYRQYETIEYKYLLFGNCLVKKLVFRNIILNLNLRHYGGEELDFAYRLNNKYPQQIIVCNTAIVRRINHPGLMEHCIRLEEFGGNNFLLLDNILKKSIIRYKLLLKKNFLLRGLIFLVNDASLKLYQLGWGYFGIIQMMMLTAILKGYYKRTK